MHTNIRLEVKTIKIDLKTYSKKFLLGKKVRNLYKNVGK